MKQTIEKINETKSWFFEKTAASVLGTLSLSRACTVSVAAPQEDVQAMNEGADVRREWDLPASAAVSWEWTPPHPRPA